MRHLLLGLFVAAAIAVEPDFGPNVLVLAPDQPTAQAQVDAIFQQQERAEFGTGRFAILLKPGQHTLDVPVGFYTHVAGLGQVPQDTRVVGRVWTDAAWMKHNATCNFWRTVENLAIEPPNGVNVWAVSQAAPMRRVLVRGDLHLSAGGWSSGGFLADCRIEGRVDAGSQQQWFSRNSTWSQWSGGAWSLVFVGCENPPVGEWPESPYTDLVWTHDVREKPFLTLVDGAWGVCVPMLRRGGTLGVSWEAGALASEIIPLERFHIARADRDTATTINAALRAGRHLLLTPGIYRLDEPLVVDNAGTIVLGIGLPTLTPTTGQAVLRLSTPDNVVVSGLVCDAGETNSDTLVEFGVANERRGRADQPLCVFDLVCRVGGYGPGRARLLVAVHCDHLIGDNFWLWRADHGSHVGWTTNTCDTGLQVDGSDVTIYGLFVEHAQKYQTIWNGERGRVFFYQSEMPYDPPSAEEWRSPTGAGYASYKVAEHVTAHDAWGLGIYHVFKQAPVVAERAIETPDLRAVGIHHAFTYRLYGGKPGSGIRHVHNQHGDETITGQKASIK
jgi:hypothetical protein